MKSNTYESCLVGTALALYKVVGENRLRALRGAERGQFRKDHIMENNILSLYATAMQIAKRHCLSLEEVKAWIEELEISLDNLSNAIAGFEYNIKEMGEEHE